MDRGAGELLVQSIDQDGTGKGYDIPLIQTVADAVRVPVIALGGAGSWDNMASVLKQGNASAVAAANIFNYMENSVYQAKQFLCDAGCNMRKPTMRRATKDAAA